MNHQDRVLLARRSVENLWAKLAVEAAKSVGRKISKETIECSCSIANRAGLAWVQCIGWSEFGCVRETGQCSQKIGSALSSLIPGL